MGPRGYLPWPAVLQAFFAAACPSVWTSGMNFVSGATVSTNMTGDIMRTPYSIGYALVGAPSQLCSTLHSGPLRMAAPAWPQSTDGAASGLNELAIQNANGGYMLASQANLAKCACSTRHAAMWVLLTSSPCLPATALFLPSQLSFLHLTLPASQGCRPSIWGLPW